MDGLKPEIAQPEVVVEDQVAENSDSPTDEQQGGTPANTNEDEPQSLLEAVEEGLKEESADQEGLDAEPDPDPDESLEPKEAEQSPESKEAKGKEDQTPEDELYKTPEGLKKEAKERFEALVAKTKESTAQTMAMKETLVGLQQVLNDTKAGPEQLGTTFDYLALRNSGNRESTMKALELAKMEVQQLAEALGIEEGGVDLLKGHPDLQKKVDDYELDRELALEIVNSRNAKNHEQGSTRQADEAKASKNQYVADRDKASLEIEAMCKSWHATDLSFNEKNAVLLEQSEEIFANYPPAQWPREFARIYKSLGKGAELARNNLKRTLKPPLKNSSGNSAVKSAGSMKDAINFGLQSLAE